MFNRMGVVIAAVIVGLLGWAAATAFFAFLLDAIVSGGNLSWDYFGHLDLIIVIPCAFVMLPSWLFVSLFAYANLRHRNPVRPGRREN